MSKYTVMVGSLTVKDRYRDLIQELVDDEYVSELVEEYPMLSRFYREFKNHSVFGGPMMFDHELFDDHSRLSFTKDGHLEFLITKNYGEDKFFPILLEDLFIPIAEDSVSYFLVDEQDKIFYVT